MTLQWPVTIDGVGYAVDTRGLQLASIPKIRQQADGSKEFGESSLNPYDLWRRTQEDWSAGAGREFLDKREDTTRRQYLESGGADPWTRGALGLTSAPAYFGDLVDVLGLVVADHKIAYVVNSGGDWSVFAIDSATVSGSGLYPSSTLFPATDLYPEDPSGSFVLLMTQSTEVAIDVCSDGYHMYVLHENGVDQVAMSDGAQTTVVTQTGDWIAFVKGRLLIGNGNELYDASAGGGGAAVEITPSTINSNWTWTCAGEAGQYILIGGVGGGRSDVYSVTVTEDGASLDVPVPAASLPFGETIQSMYGYVGSLVVGSDLGFRVAQIDQQGNLYYGPLVEVGSVQTLTAYGKFVYFGGVDEDDAAFVGKINLGLFTDALVPAYAYDLFSPATSRVLMGSETESVPAIVVLDGAIMWLVENHLWYEVPDNRAPVGYLLSGKMTYDLAETKVFERVQVACDPLTAGQSIVVTAFVDGTEYAVTTISTLGDIGGDYELGVIGDHIQVKVVLHRGSDETDGPVIKRLTVRSLPRAGAGDSMQLPLILRQKVKDLRGINQNVDTMARYLALKELEQASDLVTVNLWGTDHEAVIDGVQFGPELEYTADQQGLQGLCVVTLRAFNALEN